MKKQKKHHNFGLQDVYLTYRAAIFKSYSTKRLVTHSAFKLLVGARRPVLPGFLK